MRVVSVTSGTVFETDVAPPSAGAATAYVAIRSALRFIGHAGKSPGLMKVWAEGAVWWGDTRGLISYTLTSTSALDQTGIAQVKEFLEVIAAADELPESFRFRLPRNHSRSTRLYLELEVAAAGSTWAVDAISVGNRVASARVRKQ